MALTPSRMIQLGTLAEDFTLPCVTTGKEVSLSSFQNFEALAIMFICNHCPYVKHLEEEIARIGKDYADKKVQIVAISSNEIEGYPDDSPEKLAEQAERLGFIFPYLYDATQDVAKAYGAACTPDFYVFDSEKKLAYRGELDESRPGNNLPLNGKSIRSAIDTLLAGGSPVAEQKPSIGCNIKWK